MRSRASTRDSSAMGERPEPEHRGRSGGELAVVIGAVAVLAAVMLGVAVAAYYGGRDSATRTVTMRSRRFEFTRSIPVI